MVVVAVKTATAHSATAHAARAKPAARAAESGGGVAHRGRLLELDLNAAAGGVSDGLFGLVIEHVVLQAVTGGGRRGVRWAREHARPTRPTGGRDHGPRDARWRAASREWGNGEGGVCLRLRSSAGSYAGQGRNVFGKERVRFLMQVGAYKGREGKVFANVSAGADTKANILRRRRTPGSRSWSSEGFPRA